MKLELITLCAIKISFVRAWADDTGCMFRMTHSTASVNDDDVIGRYAATSLVGCSLKCCNIAQCGWVAMRNNDGGGDARRCLALRNHTKGGWTMQEGWEIYRKETSLPSQNNGVSITESVITWTTATTTTTTTTTTTAAVVAATLSPTATLSEKINHICQIARADYIALFSSINAERKWRCHAKSGLTTDHKFYVKGDDYISNIVADQIKTQIDTDISMSHYFVGDKDASCQTTCGVQSKTCRKKMDTLDSTYLFAKKADIQCTFSKQSHGPAYWKEQSEPYYDPGTKQCVGFVNVGNVNCNHSPGHGRRRLCKCT